ncbi:MAG: hypothetical protein EOP04_30705 [Proteobacteria bacterium]|nr:MAG: hypothetical protein EOP04_30705 [Pseudomonadota bacterium]
MLTTQNFEKGFLVNDTLMGGISRQADQQFLAYILDHDEGGIVFEATYSSIEAALDALNSQKRNWSFESTKNCDAEDCGTGSGCKGSSCKIFDECGGTRC